MDWNAIRQLELDANKLIREEAPDENLNTQIGIIHGANFIMLKGIMLALVGIGEELEQLRLRNAS